MRFLRQGSAGQAAVETAIVMPLFVFMILGLIQVSLLYQARAMLKYAAYRAARAGAMHNACIKPAQDSALAALLPVIATSGGSLRKAASASQYAQSYPFVKANNYFDGVDIVDVRICGPLKSWIGSSTYKVGSEVDFDDPQNNQAVSINGKEIYGYERTKLRIQVRLNQRMIIPFASDLIFKAWTGQQVTEALRFDKGGAGLENDVGTRTPAESKNVSKLMAAAWMGHYYLPLYANYTFRMQSNIYTKNCELPKTNRCWHYQDGNGNDP